MLEYNFTVPPNTEAVVDLVAASVESVTEGGLALSAAEGVRDVSQELGRVLVRVGAGQYAFRVEGG